MGVIVQFNYLPWAALYPELVATTNVASFTGSIAADGTLTVTAVNSGALGPGQLLLASGIDASANPTIISQLTGVPGNTGTYLTSWQAVVGSEAMIASAALNCFNQATLLHANDGTGPVENVTQQLQLLNMVTAHIAALEFGSTRQVASGLVGRISDASEGTVSVHADYPSGGEIPGTASWYSQTPYGAMYWAATAPYRTMRYRTPPPRQFNPPWPGFLWR